MSTQGNNILDKNAKIRDSFLTDDKRKRLHSLHRQIKSGTTIENALVSLPTDKALILLNKINKYIPKNLDAESRKKLNKARDLIQNQDFDYYTMKNIYAMNNDIKRIYAQAILECINEGIFNDKEVSLFDDFLILVLKGLSKNWNKFGLM
jgi:hypothetical protein